MPPYWADPHQELGWAYLARDEFVAGMQDPSTRELYQRAQSGRPNVVVFGRSQVGKTELILELLGISASSPRGQEVREVLRGGRAKGQSATVTSIVYRRNSTTDYRVQAPGRNGADVLPTSDRAREYFRSLRDKVHTGSVRTLDPLEVWLPSDAFEADSDSAVPLVVDLPGIRSGEKGESTHVPELMRYWLPVASTIVIVESAKHVARIDQLEGLSGDVLLLEPDRYKLALTFAASEGSVRDYLLGPKPPSSYAEFLTAYRGHVDQAPALKRLAIFPVEFGDSWTALGKTDPKLRDRAHEFLKTSLTNLRGVVRAGATPEASLRALLEMQRVINGKITAAKEEWTAKVKPVKQKRVTVQGEIHRWRLECDALTEQAKELGVIGQQIVNELDGVHTSPDTAAIGSNYMDARAKESVKAFQGYIAWFESHMTSVCQACGQRARETLARAMTSPYVDANLASLVRVQGDSIQRNFLNKSYMNHFSSVRRRLASYDADSYWTSWSDNHRDDTDAIGSAYGRASGQAVSWVVSVLAEASKSLADSFNRAIQACVQSAEQLRRQVRVKEEKLVELDAKVKRYDADCATTLARLQADAKRAGSFGPTLTAVARRTRDDARSTFLKPLPILERVRSVHRSILVAMEHDWLMHHGARQA